MESILVKHKRIWSDKKILRVIYEQWYQSIISNLSKSEGKSLELGAGCGNFKDYLPEIISADVEYCEWLDMCFDAHQMPFENGSLSNIIMIDVLHHLYNPIKFLEEASRVLNKGGRLIMLEPFPSPFSLFVYKRFHPEPFIFDIDYFSKTDIQDKDPWDSNQAIPYLIFFKNMDKFRNHFKNDLKILKREKQSFLLYPASGGFENKQIISDFMIPIMQGVENILKPFKSFLAFRCFLVLEKK